MAYLSALVKFYDAYEIYGVWVLLFLLMVIIFFLLRILFDEDRSALWRGRFYKVIYSINGKREYEKKYISNDINGRINLARRKFHFGEDLLPRAVKVEWVEEKAGETYDLKEREFIICLSPSICQEANIVKLATAVVKRTTLLGLRHFLEKPLIAAIDLNLIRNILSAIKNQKSLEWFFSQEYSPSMEKNQDLSNWSQKINVIDEKGLFTRVLLVELTDFARRTMGMIPRPYMIGEIEDFIKFLHKIATKKPREQVPLDFVRTYIRVGIMLVAQTYKILEKGISPYLYRMGEKLNKQFNTVYLIIYDKEVLGDIDPKLEEEFNNITKDLEDTIQTYPSIAKNFDAKYRCIDTRGVMRDAKIIRYTLEYS